MKVFTSLFVTLVAVLCMGCGSYSPVEAQSAKQSTNPSILVDDYLIGVEDQLQISVWKNPDLSVSVPVRPDGKISMPLAGEIMAGGRTPKAVAEDITRELSEYIRDPQVAVILQSLVSHEFLSRVRVSGAVQEPISMPFRQGMTVLDLVLEAGGLSEYASGNSAKLYRQTEEGVETIRIRLDNVLNQGKMETNYLVEPGDIITVPERIF